MPYHLDLTSIAPPLPPPWDTGPNWVKGDMIYSVSFDRLDFIRVGKTYDGRQIYRYNPLSEPQIRAVRACVLHALGLGGLTKNL